MTGVGPDRDRPRFRHLGLFTFDPEVMAEFYCREFGMVETDRGTGTTGHTVIFLSADPAEHHQLALANGREPGSKPSANQISFRVDSLADLKAYASHYAETGIPLLQTKTHGNAISIYFLDPEGNTIEIYCHTPWHVQQPRGQVVDLTRPDDEILAESQAMCRSDPSFLMREDWSRGVAEKLRDRLGEA